MADVTVEKLLRARPPQRALDWVARTIGTAKDVTAVAPLYGGVSHATHRIALEGEAGTRSVVLRRWVRPDWRDDNADYTAAHEAETLTLLEHGGVPAPRLIGVDDAAQHADVPAVIATLVPGTKPRLSRQTIDATMFGLASAIAAVHELRDTKAREVAVPYVRYYRTDELQVPSWSARPELWQRAIEIFAMPPQSTDESFIHRDYHPGNTLWHKEELSGILDWERGSWGPIGVDLAHMRVNLARMGRHAAAERYTEAYRSITGRRLDDLPYWDVVDSVDLMPEMHTASATAQRNVERFVGRALRALG